MPSPGSRCRFLIASALLLAPPAAALAGDGTEIRSFTVDGGGGMLIGASLELIGTIGQPDAGPALSSISFELTVTSMGPSSR